MSTQRRAEVFILCVTVIWGSTFVVTKSFLDETSPLFYTAVRFLLAAFLLGVVFPRRFFSIPLSTVQKGSVLGLLLYVGFALQTIGMQYTTASKSAFFTGMLVVLTPIVHVSVQHIFRLPRRGLKLGNVVGVVCAAIGLYLLTSPAGSGFNIGDFLTLFCALMFAGYIVYLDFASGEPDKLQLTFIQFVVCGVLGLICALPFEDIRVATSGGYIVSLLYLTIFATVIAMWVQNRFQGDTTPTRAAVIFALEPVIAGILAYVFRGENIGITGVVGGGIIITGLLLSEFSEEIPLLNKSVTAG